ncbi:MULTISPECIES: glycosyltransferase [Kocuria]|uniref:Glycosyl transferase family 28 C-terminal domain-containing protein n=1 Tax=Kocuria subflava TaxID=1736139 RepID=A0A846TSS2_9MICC|nr:glycosyltransferase [Kocuria sp. CPCC 104605]NKE09859.1 hypothetical protein [Kocuria subflava]
MIGFYAHHHGSGHMTRCRALAAELSVTHSTAILSSRDDAEVVLPLDAPASAGLTPAQLTAHGVLHWAPPGHRGLADRMAAIATWIQEHRPAAFHVDVSVEVAVLVRAMGVPVTVQAMPGHRPDAPHMLGYSLADAVIAAWPRWVPVPEHLAHVADRVHQVGGISRFPTGDLDLPPASSTRPRVVIMFGTGGTDSPEGYWDDVVTHLNLAGFDCIVIGGRTWVPDPRNLLERADVIITAAGQNSVADVAALGRRAVVVAQERPFQEQEATARILREAGLAVTADSVAGQVTPVRQWEHLVREALDLRPDWHRWETQGAVQRAAHVIREVAG